MRVNGKLVAVRHPSKRRFDLWVSIPGHDSTIRVTATAKRGRQSHRSVSHVFGLPRAAQAARHARPPRSEDSPTASCRSSARFPAQSAVYVRDLTTGAGAAWNARAEFPAASTLKLAIAVETLRSLHGKPAPGSYADSLLHRALIYSDNGAANDLEVLYAGSTSGGSVRVNALMRSLGLVDTEMYGGYERGTASVPIPARVDEQPYYGIGKHTSAYDLAQLFGFVHLATAGKGPLAKRYGSAFTPSDARYLLYLLAHSADHGKLDRFVAGHGAWVMHKAGWITSARHDAGLVYWHGGVFAVAVMTYGAASARPPTSSPAVSPTGRCARKQAAGRLRR